MPNSMNQKTQQGTGNSRSNFTQRNKPNTNSTSRPKGKSKFAQKSRSKKFVKPVSKPKEPVSSYTSVCCSLPAKKPRAGELPAGSKVRLGLGHFRCTGCGKVAKVTVSKFKTSTEAPIDAAVTAVEVELAANLMKEVPVAS
jgi:hypothetical protein